MRFGTICLTTVSYIVVTAFTAVAAQAQSAADSCLRQGYKPGTPAFYRCLQDKTAAQGHKSGKLKSPDTGEAGSILGGSPDNAVTDYSGSTMSGATTPDPNILKQLLGPEAGSKSK